MDKIDIRDLRIDNWIYHKDCPIPLQVSGFNGNEVYLKHSFEHNRTVGFVRQDRPSVCSIDDIRLVPLTPEILEKNRWKKQPLSFTSKETCLGIWRDSKSDTTIKQFFIDRDSSIFVLIGHFSKVGNIKYVHQLQNILIDLGVEKEINI